MLVKAPQLITTVFITSHKTVRTLTLKMFVFYFFISDVDIYQILKPKLKTCHNKRRHSSLSLSTFNYSVKAAIFMIQTKIKVFTFVRNI